MELFISLCGSRFPSGTRLLPKEFSLMSFYYRYAGIELCFSLSEEFFISPSFLEDNFSVNGISCSQFFFQYFNDAIPFFLSCVFSVEESDVILSFVLLYLFLFSSGYFQEFYFIFGF